MRDEADVMLYLVNAAESPEAAGYVAPEMELLGLDRQAGDRAAQPARRAARRRREAAELARWRAHLATHSRRARGAAARRVRALLGAGG